MLNRALLSAALAVAIAAVPAERVLANDALIGGIIGGAIGSAISNDIQRKRQPQRTTRSTTSSRSYRAPTVSSAQREENRSVQHALNYFGFNAGGADGVLGRRSRAAISAYQAHLSYPPTGTLTPYEQQFLLTSHNRALAGGPATQTAIAKAGGLTSGLLIAWRNEATGGGSSNYGGLPQVIAASVDEIADSSDPSGEQLIQRAGFIQLADMNGDGQTDYLIDTSVTGSAFWCNAQSCAVRVFVSTPEGYERNDFQAFNVTPAMFSCTRGLCQMPGTGATTLATAPAPAAPAPGTGTQLVAAAQAPQASIPVATAVPSNPGAGTPTAPAATTSAGLPTFFAQPTTEASLASHCNTVSLLTTTNGGFTSVSNMTDPNAALAEQFCLARTYAIANGETLIAKVTGVSAADIEAQCKGLASALSGAAASLALQDVSSVRQEVGNVVLASGMAPAALADSSRICLSVGYRTDDMQMAVASALLLVAVGNEPYAELLGHHLGQGFGTPKRGDLSLAWYELASSAIDRGAEPAFVPGQPERSALIRAAADMLAGKAPAQVVPAGTEASGSALPLFSVSD